MRGEQKSKVASSEDSNAQPQPKATADANVLSAAGSHRSPWLAVFIVACLVVCVLPFVGLVVTGPSGAVGNEQPTPRPEPTTEDGSPNVEYASQLGDYFEHNFALRPEAMTLDALVQAKVFGTSNIDSIVVGKEGWLYYASTLDDYLGRNTLTERQAKGIAHNLELIQNRVEQTGSRFVFTIAPNKNTLYPQFMPDRFDVKVSSAHNRDVLAQALGGSEVDYCDLFALFQRQEDILYHAQDSHWNNEGALLAYQDLMDALGKTPLDYSDMQPQERADFACDLAAMIYPASHVVEDEFYYPAQDAFASLSGDASVEDPTIRTEDPTQSGSLYMYRDSFGNALVPYFASSFNKCFFTKSFPMMLDIGLQTSQPTDVIFEIAERNAAWLIETPPVMVAPQVPYQGRVHASGSSADVKARPCPYSQLYLEVSGAIDPARVPEGEPVYLYIESESGARGLYECFDCTNTDGVDGFLAYLPAAEYGADAPLSVSVMIAADTGYKVLGSSTVECEE